MYNHLFLPTGYDYLEKEHWKLLNDVTVWDVSVERQVEITGPDGRRATVVPKPFVAPKKEVPKS